MKSLNLKVASRTQTGMVVLLEAQKEIKAGAWVYDTLDRKSYIFGGVEYDGMVELRDPESDKALPDLRHPTQVFAW